MKECSIDNIKYDYKLFIGSSHTWALTQILKKFTNKNDSILDIGSSIGMMGNLLKNHGFSNLDAVEINENARNIASKYYNTMYDDLSKVNKKYDLLLLLDVLEHTVDHKEFFKEVISKLNKNGILLLSVPNIAHWYTRFSLLFGNFNYTEKGILDNTHLHFFTRKTIINFVNSFNGIKIESINASTSPIEMFISKKIRKSFLYKIFAIIKYKWVNLFPRILGYQHLLVIRKND